MPGTSTMEPWWAPRRVSRLHWTSLSDPSPFLLSPASVTPRIPPCHQISPSPEEASVSSAAPLVQPPTVKRSCRTGSRRSGSLWPRCMTCKTHHPPALMPRPPQIFLHPLHHPSELHRAGSQGFRCGGERDAGNHCGNSHHRVVLAKGFPP